MSSEEGSVWEYESVGESQRGAPDEEAGRGI